LLRTYVRLIADWGRKAAAVAESFDDELRPGKSVQVVGVRGGPESQTCTAVLQDMEAVSGRWVVAMPDGGRSAVRPENLRGAKRSPRGPADREELSIQPPCAPCGGGAFEAEVRCGGLDRPISEVLVDGAPAEVLSATTWSARVRIPPRIADGPARVEVRAAGWRRRVAESATAFRYFQPVGFGASGGNVRLSAAPDAAPGAAPAVATRFNGLLQAVAITAAPIGFTPRPPPSTKACERCGASQTRDRYFELEVQELGERRGSIRTLLAGFIWRPLPHEEGVQGDAWPTRRAPLLDSASQMPRCLVVGGDLPRAFLGGRDLKRIAGWRPLVDLTEGCTVGVLLEESQAEQEFAFPACASSALLAEGRGSAGLAVGESMRRHQLTIFQDGVRRCSVEADVPEAWGDDVFGIVDVCGTVQRIALRQAALPPGQASPAGSSKGELSPERRPEADPASHESSN